MKEVTLHIVELQPENSIFFFFSLEPDSNSIHYECVHMQTSNLVVVSFLGYPDVWKPGYRYDYVYRDMNNQICHGPCESPVWNQNQDTGAHVNTLVFKVAVLDEC